MRFNVTEWSELPASYMHVLCKMFRSYKSLKSTQSITLLLYEVYVYTYTKKCVSKSTPRFQLYIIYDEMGHNVSYAVVTAPKLTKENYF